uniref:CSON003470 protein n=1 Tax=Culicoides sonorensis TaxID=179676 RepID=A0A336MQ52_CULSO
MTSETSRKGSHRLILSRRDNISNNSSKKPSVMETLKRKSSDTYLNAVKVSTNIINNNNSTSNGISSSSSLHVNVKGPVEMTPSVNKNQPTQQQQQTSSVSFNNDQKYLHKKFKRIASATTVENNFTEIVENNLGNHHNNNNNNASKGNDSPETSSAPSVTNSNDKNFSSANNSHQNHHPHSTLNNNNLVNNFKVVQSHTTPQQNNFHHQSVPQVMTAYENYIITKEKLTHHQLQQMDVVSVTPKNNSFNNKNNNPNLNNSNNSHNNNNINKKHENNPPNSMPSTSTVYRVNLNEVYSNSMMPQQNHHQPQQQQQLQHNESQSSTPGKYIRRISPVDERTSSPSSQQSQDKPYKPKFHLYPGKNTEATGNVNNSVNTKVNVSESTAPVSSTSASNVIPSKPLNSGGSNFVLTASAAESVKQHIQKLISQNSAIIDGVEPALQKKYHKITGINRSISVDNTLSSSSSSSANIPHQRKSSLSIPPREPIHHNNIAHVPMTIAPNNIVIVAPKTPTVQNGPIQLQYQSQLIHPSQATPHSVQIIQQPIMLTSTSLVHQSSPSHNQHNHMQHHHHGSAPLNLATNKSGNSYNEINENNCDSAGNRSRKTSQEMAGAEIVPVVDHPKNPERSIIKDLLLNSRTFGVVAEGETNETPYICQTCKKVFQNADLLKYHTFCHCDGGEMSQQQIQQIHRLQEGQSPQSAPISPVASPHQYIRSNSINATSLPESRVNSSPKVPNKMESERGNPVKIIARQSRQKPENIIIGHVSNASPVIEGANIEQYHLIPHHKNLIDVPLPSPGPLLGKTPLIDMYSMHPIRGLVDAPQVIERKLSLSEVEEYHQHSSSHKRPRFNSTCVEMSHPNMMRGYANDSKMQMFGGDVKIMEKNCMTQYNSGGTMSSLSPNSDEMMEDAPVMVRTGLHSGGIAVPIEKEKHEKLPMTPKLKLTITPTLTITQTTQSVYQQKQAQTHFPYPPINTISGYNPLTLPPVISSSPSAPVVQSIMHGGKLIPFVPGIPGPNTMNSKVENTSNKIMACPKTPVMASPRASVMISPRNNVQTSIPSIKLEPVDDVVMGSNQSRVSMQKSFNFSRIADNISPSSRKSEQDETPAASVVKLHHDQSDVRIFNYENLIAKNEIIVRSGPVSDTVIKSVVVDEKPPKIKEESRPNKFLRPNSLPLKPGTFTPKQHHGITPTANTLPLISPETPRPSKCITQQYHNGHAYTYLGLKCSTKPFYCTVNKPQPAYIVTQAKLSMYSNWQVYPENNPHALGLEPLKIMESYRSYFNFERNRKYTIAQTSKSAAGCSTVISSPETRVSVQEQPSQFKPSMHQSQYGSSGHQNRVSLDENPNNGGEEVYVRGRGRGKYVCSECGIRCKKPSMLKKHIRTHTDVRPYTCTNCNFSFKTKGNLTKHMKSKAHYKKCIELGIPVEEYQGSEGDTMSGGPERQNNMGTGYEDESENDSDCDADGDNDETDSEENDENRSRLPEHEAARCLLSLSMTPPATAIASNVHQQPNSGQQKQSQTSQNVRHQIISEKMNEPRLDEMTCRRIITFAAPKSEFDLHGQYYSDPNLIKVSNSNERHHHHHQSDGQNETDECPIDLTKRSKDVESPSKVNHQSMKHHHQFIKPNVSDVVSKISSPANMLASLFSITDKFALQNQNGEHFMGNLEQNNLPDKYITDRALQDLKSKQIQMKMTSSNLMQVQEKPSIQTVPEQITVTPTVVLERREPIAHSETAGISMMDTLAEVAASSVKLDVTPIHSPKISSNEENSKNSSNCSENESRNSNAKSIATEFLKLTQNVKNQEKSSENEADAESGSDQDAIKDKFVSRNIVVGPSAFNATNKKPKVGDSKPAFMHDEGRQLCPICKKVFPKQSALKLHLNIHAMERKYKCGPCGQGFRTQGHLQKHNRSAQHQTKVSMTSTFGVPSQSNPRPFKCNDCSTQFRIHGHLAKHLRSKLHVMRLECLQKLPFGTYAEIERSGISLTNIDTSDCETSLASLQELARKIHENDPTKLIPVDQNNTRKISESDQGLDEQEDDAAGTGMESEGDYADSDDGQITNEPINGLKRPYSVTFAMDKVPNSPNNKGSSDTEKSLQDPLKLDSPVQVTTHHEDHMTEKRLKLSNDT